MLLAACGGQPTPQSPPVLITRSGAGDGYVTFVVPKAHGWDVHWSYDCGSHGVFVMDVFDADLTPDFKFPGVEEEGTTDSGVYHVLGSGRFYLKVTTTCTWSVRVVELQS